jgi:predicted dehydrogenase
VTRIAVIGIGTWGRQLIRVFDGLGDVVVACSRGGEAGHEWLRTTYPEIRAGSSAADALDDQSVEAIVIATSIPSHAPLAVTALERGKHVFVEKPLATSAVEAEKVVAAARAANRTLFVGHTFLFDAGFEALRDITAADPVEHIELSWLKYGTFREPLVWNLLPHEVALATWLVGRPPALSVVERASGQTALDRLVLDLDFGPGGPTGSIEIDRLHDHKVKTARVRLRSGAELRWQDGNLARIVGGRVEERLIDHSEEALVREARAFLEAVAGGRHGRSDGPFGTEVVRVIEPIAAALESAAESGLEAAR